MQALQDFNRKNIANSALSQRILLVDDDRSILTLLHRHASRLGFSADLAENGEEAVALLKESAYPLVISDIMMPVMDGMELLSHIKERYPETDVLIVSAYGSQYSFSDLIAAGASDFIAKPFESDEFQAKVQRIFRERSLLAELNQGKEKEKLFFLRLVETLAMSLDEKDRYTHGHTRRVTNLAQQLAGKFTDRDIDMELLRLSALLHDIGKIGVPDALLGKVEPLTVEEFSIIKKHPEQGARILQPMAFDVRMQDIARIIRHHHERFDGKGYPDGLAGEAIPFYSRIIAIADSYDAMTSDRPYRKGMDYKEALVEIERNGGLQFDPVLAEAFIALMQGCQRGRPCPSLDGCEIFSRIEGNIISKAYEMQYCRTNYKACARYKIKDKEKRPPTLLPDGSFFLDGNSRESEVNYL